MRRISALLLLLVLGLGLSGGAHPCQGRTEAAPAPQAHPPCHDMAPKPEPKTQGDCGSHDEGQPCPHICHVMAVVAVTSMPFVVERVTRIADPSPVRSPRPLVRSIDHIPLA
jgi:hypothetical protein